MIPGGAASAQLPPDGIAELDPAWSRLVTVDLDGTKRTFHVLDNGVPDPSVTLLCVHGNPTWSYLWRRVIASAPRGVRVIAPDHLGMGFSERTGTLRRLERRVFDLSALAKRLDIAGPVVTVAHDWGGPISLGWAQRNRPAVAGVVLTNTAVHQPDGASVPSAIRLARHPAVLDRAAAATSGFLRGALRFSTRMPRPIRDGYLAPYGTPERRRAIANFIRDIPLDPSHPSHDALDRIAAGLRDFDDVPTFLLWGAQDPVFSDIYLHDLENRLPHAAVHRFAAAGHMVPEDIDIADAVFTWLTESRRPPEPVAAGATSIGSRSSGPAAVDASEADSSAAPALRNRRLWERVAEVDDPRAVALVEMDGASPRGTSVSFATLGADIDRIAAGLYSAGVSGGDRVALLVPPGMDLTACLYACWKLGAVTVIVDAGLGARGIGAALASASPDHLIGIDRALAAARVLRWPGSAIALRDLPSPIERALGVASTVPDLRQRGDAVITPTPPDPSHPVAIAFTSGATGPAKGVRYLHHQAEAQVEALVRMYDIVPEDRLVAAFAPFALYGPAMGIASVVPDMDVTRPSTLSAGALGDAAIAIDATMVFASPAALRNVVATAGELTAAHRDALTHVRLLLSAGAPVSPKLLRSSRELMPNAEAHTPYGMTEVLPVADISLTDIERVGSGTGVCVGSPLDGVSVLVDPLDSLGFPAGEPVADPETTGEVCVNAAHVSDGYDRLWLTERNATLDRHSATGRWHRTGDVGHLDTDGRLWIEGRLAHVISTATGPVTPVAVEQAVETIREISQAAAVGVGPTGAQVVVVAVVANPRVRRPQLANRRLTDAIREQVPVDVAAAFSVPRLPVDRRHNSKIDRQLISAWASAMLSGDSWRPL